MLRAPPFKSPVSSATPRGWYAMAICRGPVTRMTPLPQGGYTHIAIRGDRLMAWMLLTGKKIVTVN